eukprot:5096848-Amphidinium_carterae.1
MGGSQIEDSSAQDKDTCPTSTNSNIYQKQLQKALLDANADANVRNEFNRTPFDEAFQTDLKDVWRP